jgi:hypothetical protein
VIDTYTYLRMRLCLTASWASNPRDGEDDGRSPQHGEMEFKLSASSAWIPCGGRNHGLVPGT